MLVVAYRPEVKMKLNKFAGGRAGQECYGSERDRNRMKSYFQVQDAYT